LETQSGRHSGKLIWKFIRDIQRGRRGLVPTRSAVVRDKNGEVCITTEEQNERWRRHFTNVLNVSGDFDVEELGRVKQRPLRPEMAELPTKGEILKAIEKMASGKAGGESCILPEIVKAACIGDVFLRRLLELVHDVWKEKSVPSDWRGAIVIPIPKKGDLSHCDNWRGISLLDVIRNVVARILFRSWLRMSYQSCSVSLGEVEGILIWYVQCVNW
jgi:hypothetical protein